MLKENYNKHQIGKVFIYIPKNYTREKLPFKRKWISALKSGKYPQGKGKLFDDGKYCCLGVLSKVQGRLLKGSDGNRNKYFSLAFDNPCDFVLKGSGQFPIEIAVFYKKEKIISLARLNDSGVPFKQIAEIIHLIWKE